MKFFISITDTKEDKESFCRKEGKQAGLHLHVATDAADATRGVRAARVCACTGAPRCRDFDQRATATRGKERQAGASLP